MSPNGVLLWTCYMAAQAQAAYLAFAMACRQVGDVPFVPILGVSHWCPPVGLETTMSTFTEYTTLSYVTEQCFKCGVRFAMDSRFHTERKKNGDEFYCPNGHGQIYSEKQTTEEKLRAAELALSTTRNQLSLERDQKAAAQQSLERLKKRASKGVCPCCQRTVRQLAAHMKTKHPEWPRK